MVSQTEAALRERVKELSCLYGIAQIAGKPGVSLEEILHQIVVITISSGLSTQIILKIFGR